MAKYDSGYTPPFAATAADVRGMYMSKPEGEPPDPFDFCYSPVCIPVFIIDLPFSIVTDTITLPYDLYHRKDVGKTKKQPQPPSGDSSTRVDAGLEAPQK